MLAHIIQNGIATNSVEVESLVHPDGLLMVPATATSDIGDTWDGINFIKPPAPPKNRDQLKVERDAQVAAIKVTTQAGNTFDGDETSQTRMARAVIALQATGTPSVTWVLADNTPIEATAAELSEALALAGAAQAALWVIE